MSRTLAIDLYELNMAASYLRQDMTDSATFSLFCRRLPSSRGFLIAAGLEDCLSYLEDFSFDEEDLEYLANIGFSDETLRDFSALRFTGDVWAVPEGTAIFANEPNTEVTAPIAEAQLVETYLLNQCSFQTTLATKAARCRLAAAGQIDLVDFSLRRTQGIEAGHAVARLSAMCGFLGTSNVEAARRFGLRPAGTMAHSYIEAFENELEAFVTFAGDLPEQTIFLVDTYDTVTGVKHAIRAIRELDLADQSAIRIDSGNLADVARHARELLDKAELPAVKIFVSGGLDEHDLARFVADAAPIDAAGIGTRMGVSADAPYLDTAYKLVSYAHRPVMKLSPDKTSLPGPKQVFRASEMRDTIARRDEKPTTEEVPLLELMMTGGQRTRGAETISSLQIRLESQLRELPDGARTLVSPVAPIAEVSDALHALDDEVRAAATAIADQ